MNIILTYPSYFVKYYFGVGGKMGVQFHEGVFKGKIHSGWNSFS